MNTLDPKFGEPLTQRERDAITAYVRTGDQRRAAFEMGIAYQTVKTHLWCVYQKLGVDGILPALEQLGWLRVPGDLDADARARQQLRDGLCNQLHEAIEQMRTSASDFHADTFSASEDRVADRDRGPSTGIAMTGRPHSQRRAA